MPAGSVYVGRPSVWGNRWQIGTWSNTLGRAIATAQEAVDLYRELMWLDAHYRAWVRKHLAGRVLVCWCKPDAPCHADVLLAIANAGEDSRKPPRFPQAA